MEEAKSKARSELAAMTREIREAVGNGGQTGVVFPTVTFDRTDRAGYTAEAGKKDGDVLFHFWPSAPNTVFTDVFRERLADAFLAVFPHPDQLCWDYVEELYSWVVKARGYASNPWADALARKVFDELDKRLGIEPQ